MRSSLSTQPSKRPSKRPSKTQPAKLKVLGRYVKVNALLAIIGAVLGLWALQLLFSYLSELDSLNDSYTMSEVLKYILYRSPYF